MATSCKHHHLEPTYKQHTAVEDSHGVIVDVGVTTGEACEGGRLLEQLERIQRLSGAPIRAVTCDSAYARGANYRALEEQGIEAVIPPPKPALAPQGKQKIPLRRFKYDALKDVVICPEGKRLERKGRASGDGGFVYRARACDCKHCPLRSRCVPETASSRSVVIVDGYPALLRARRRKGRGWDEATHARYTRHRWQVEGVHGRSKTQHGLGRAVRRGLDNVSIQAYLTAAALNLKKLATRGAPQGLLRTLTRALRHTASLYRLLKRLVSKNRIPALRTA